MTATMKNLLGASIGFVAGIFVGSAATWFLSSQNQTTASHPDKLLGLTSRISGNDQYEIQWIGVKGSKMLGGSYSIVDIKHPGKPIRVEAINTLLPHTLKISQPSGNIIGATAGYVAHGKATVILFKNGVECTDVAITGAGLPDNKTCK